MSDEISPAGGTGTLATVDSLLSAATHGDERAWAELVARYLPLVRSVIHRHGLTGPDAADVNQTLWLRLVEHLDEIRNPAALPMWIIQTTRRECLRMLRLGRRTWPLTDLDGQPAPDADVDEHVLRLERQQALRDGFAQLPLRCRELLALLTADPPASYEEISERLSMPIGSIGPTRSRCLHKLRTCPAVVAFLGRQALDGAEPRPVAGGSAVGSRTGANRTGAARARHRAGVDDGRELGVAAGAGSRLGAAGAGPIRAGHGR